MLKETPITLVADLKNALAEVPDTNGVLAQVVAADGTAWMMEPNIGGLAGADNKAGVVVITLRHPELKTMPKRVEGAMVRRTAPTPATHPEMFAAVRLKWEGGGAPASGQYGVCTASTPFGRFLITWRGWGLSRDAAVEETPWGAPLGVYSTLQGAQAACEAALIGRLCKMVHDSDKAD